MSILTSAILLGTQTFAAQHATCINRVLQQCSDLTVIVALPDASNECRIVQSGFREDDGTRYDEKIVFAGDKLLSSIRLSQLGCSIIRVNVGTRIKEVKALDGRVYSLTEDGRVIVVSRSNSAHRLLNSRNIPYTSVTDIAISQNRVYLTFENGQKTDLDASEVFQRLNSPAAEIR